LSRLFLYSSAMTKEPPKAVFAADRLLTVVYKPIASLSPADEDVVALQRYVRANT